MSYTDAFLQAILNDPEDDTVRLIYADWLEERGDPRGEFIRLQCRLAGLPVGHPERAALKRRERELLRKYAEEWSRPVNGLAVADWTFRRGFIEEVTMRAEAFLRDAQALFGAVPLRCLHLEQAAWHLTAVVGVPGLARLSALDLDISNGHPTSNTIGSLGSLPCLSRLNLSHSGLTDADLDALLEVRLPRLTALDLSSNRITARGARALASWPRLEQLRELRLNHNRLGLEGIEVLLAAPALRPPEIFSLEGNGISAKFLQTLLRQFAQRTGCRGNRLGLPCLGDATQALC
jgi:uncharacterized protein (TIGR02996 family)